jgi:hypothetical protein
LVGIQTCRHLFKVALSEFERFAVIQSLLKNHPF